MPAVLRWAGGEGTARLGETNIPHLAMENTPSEKAT